MASSRYGEFEWAEFKVQIQTTGKKQSQLDTVGGFFILFSHRKIKTQLYVLKVSNLVTV
jgi:hypothetical protein